MHIVFEPHYQQKILWMTFGPGTELASVESVQAWKDQWLKQLSSWHSPYKAFIDLNSCRVEESPEILGKISIMLKFFAGFYMQRCVLLSPQIDFLEKISFDKKSVFSSREEAEEAIGMRAPRVPREAKDFRERIQLENHFVQHTVELTFSDDVAFDSVEKINVLRSKLTNNLMQWHSKWNLIADCSKADFAAGFDKEWGLLLKSMRGLFLKNAVGYGRAAREADPWPVYRARHKAAAALEAEGFSSGDQAVCKSKQA